MHRALILLFAIFFNSCSSSPEKPQLNLAVTTVGLNTTIAGKAIDVDGAISKVIIDWNDNSPPKILLSAFDKINESHTYSAQGNFEILVTAIDNTGDSTTIAYLVTISFTPTSLEGINPNLYKSSSNELLFLTLNLHTYQETNQIEKLKMIAAVIGEMEIDFIAFQECAQHKNTEVVNGNIRKDNMALLITEILKTNYDITYNFNWDWAHYGWDVWEEGIATMAKYPLIETESRYISSSTSKTTIESRKVIYSAYQFNNNRIHLFSAHTHWRTSQTSEEQNNQIKNIQEMVAEKEVPNSYSFVAGDFNGNPTSDYPWSEGYNTMVNGYVDTYYAANPDANNKPAQSQHHTVLGDFPGRIDYVFMKNNEQFEVKASQIIFKSGIVGNVSDHYGVLTKVSLK